MKMIFLRGKKGDYGLPDGTPFNWKDGALDEESAGKFATLRGYTPAFINVPGDSTVNSKQMNKALEEVRADDDVFALYGFSAGGYTIYNLLHFGLTKKEKQRLALVVVLGAPPPPPVSRYRGPWELIFREDPAIPRGHMNGPRVLLSNPYGSL
jgi:hypothetical protein